VEGVKDNEDIAVDNSDSSSGETVIRGETLGDADETISAEVEADDVATNCRQEFVSSSSRPCSRRAETLSGQRMVSGKVLVLLVAL
jgi:hypothetical protein